MAEISEAWKRGRGFRVAILLLLIGLLVWGGLNHTAGPGPLEHLKTWLLCWHPFWS